MSDSRPVDSSFLPMLVLPVGPLDAPTQCFACEEINLGLLADESGKWHAVLSMRRGLLGQFMPLDAPTLRDLAAIYVQKAHDLEQIAAGRHPMSPAMGGKQ